MKVLMKLLKNIIEYVLGTAIIWAPIVATIIAESLAEVITIDRVMNVVYIAIPIVFGIIIKFEIEERSEKNGN